MQSKVRDFSVKADFVGSAAPTELYSLVCVVLLLSYAASRIGFVSGIVVWSSAWLLFILFENTWIHSAQVRWWLFWGRMHVFT